MLLRFFSTSSPVEEDDSCLTSGSCRNRHCLKQSEGKATLQRRRKCLDRAARQKRTISQVASAMRRLEERFDAVTVKQIRMDCQCGWKKLALLKRLKSKSSNMEEFASLEETTAAGCLTGTVSSICSLNSAPVRCWHKCRSSTA